jgi:hypothetical protein
VDAGEIIIITAFPVCSRGGTRGTLMLCYVMVPLLPPVDCVEDSWGWGTHATSASGRRDSRVRDSSHGEACVSRGQTYFLCAAGLVMGGAPSVSLKLIIVS